MSTADEPALASDSRIGRGALARGAVAGVAAWLLGYLVVYVWKADAVAEALRGVGVVSQLLGGEAVPAWKGVTWLFLNAHFVATRVPAVAGGTRTANFATGEAGSVALLALPVLVLLVAGVLAAWGRSGGPTAGAATGATLVVGYLPLSAVAAFATTHAIGETQVTVSPDPVTAVLLAGAVYPIAVGAVGGAVAALVE